jgi:HYDIN/CFA65/VesB-like, Ig-like domain
MHPPRIERTHPLSFSRQDEPSNPKGKLYIASWFGANQTRRRPRRVKAAEPRFHFGSMLIGIGRLIPDTGGEDTGAASSPVFYASVSALNFGPQNIGVASSAANFNIYNEGTVAMSISGSTITGANAADFNISFNNCPSSLNPGNGCTLSVIFTPSMVGPETAAVQVGDNATGNPHLITLNGVGQTPASNALTLATTQITFPTTDLGISSGAVGFNVYNYGTTAITFTGFTITGGNASDFGITFNNCGSSLAVSGGCTINVTFTPTAVGPRAATLQIASSATGSPQTVSLFGTALPQTEDVIVNYDTLAFAATNVGTTSAAAGFSIYNYGTSTVTFAATNPVTITGTNSGDFSIILNNCGTTLAAGSGCTINVTFRPSALGPRNATVQIADDAPGSPQSVSLLGVGQPVTTSFEISETTLNFGSQLEDTTSTQHNLTMYNEGTGAMSFAGTGAFVISGTNASDFTVSFNNCGSSLSSGLGCTVGITFTPSTAGLESATLTITDSDASSPQQIQLLGFGLQPAETLEFQYTSFTFASTNIGTTSAAATEYIYNVGTAPITFSGATITGANAGDFTITNNICGTTTVAPGSYCYVQIAFAPTAAGSRAAMLQVTDTASGSPQSISLFGTGASPTQMLGFEYSSLTFAAQTVGTTSSLQSMYLYNTGNSTISFSSFNITGTNASEFTIQSNGCSTQLTGGSACYMYITFTPAATGQRVATVQVTDTATGSPQSFSVFGTGQ